MKLNFNQRVGLEPIDRPFQIDQIDRPLRNGIWNVYFPNIIEWFAYHVEVVQTTSLMRHIWCNFMKEPIDIMPRDMMMMMPFLRDLILQGPWNEVYGLIETTVSYILVRSPAQGKVLASNFNRIFERECSGYRFVADEILPFTNRSEMSSIEEAISTVALFSSLTPCNAHLAKSLKCLSQKPVPDYTNSIKEAISAVEALVNILVGEEKGSLGDTIGKLPPGMRVHRALIGSIKKIYGYASDEAGVRHGTSLAPQSDLDDAKFMLVTCSAIVNLLVSRAMKSNLLPSESSM